MKSYSWMLTVLSLKWAFWRQCHKTFFLCWWRGQISWSVHNWQSLFSLVYYMLVIPGAFPRWKHLKGAPIGLTLALPSNSKTWLERVSKDKHSSLLGLIILSSSAYLAYKVLTGPKRGLIRNMIRSQTH